MSDVVGFIGAGQMGEPMVGRLLGGRRLSTQQRKLGLDLGRLRAVIEAGPMSLM